MARLFADGFDMYATVADMGSGRWTTPPATSGAALVSGASTAFSVGQALRLNNINAIGSTVFETATNETTIFFSLRVRNTSGSLSSHYVVLGFRDGANSQATIMWRGDGAILVYSGSSTGTILTTLTAAYSANTWDSYQGKIVINNTTGSVEIRKNGSTTPIINLTGVNTRAGSTNAYANAAILAMGGNGYTADFDDFWLNSDNGAAPTTWPGDVRCVTSMVAAVSGSAAFSPSPSTYSVATIPNNINFTTARATGVVIYNPFTATFTGTLGSVTVAFPSAGTGNVKLALYDSLRQTVLGASNAVAYTGAGTVTFTFSSPPTVIKGTTYYIAADQDFSLTWNSSSIFSTAYSGTTAYSSFPAAAPSTTGTTYNQAMNIVITPTNNAEFVSDATEDGDTSTVYSSTVSAEEKYTIAALTVTPASILGVCPFVMWKKSDSGARTANLSVTANGSSDTAEVSGVTPSLSYGYAQKFMPLDPTGAAWTTANVNGALLGITVAS